MKLNRSAICLYLSICLTSCISIPKNEAEDAKELDKGPTTLPNKNITDFSDALSCMDELILSQGIDRFTILAEDIYDNTKKINASTRDLLISAVSDMTKHSSAINIIAFGNDSEKLISFLSQAGKKNIYNDVPIYDIRGSITQLDNNVINKQTDDDTGIPEFSFGAAASLSASVLGLDLSIVNTSDLSVLAGVTSRNIIVIRSRGIGGGTEATIKKLGINFSLNINRNQGSSQALRTLVELTTIELFGKLLKLPYWACLGADAMQDTVKNEINDWFYAMQANHELTPYMQNQLYRRGLYFNETDGRMTPEFEKAVALFRISQQMPSDNKVDEAVFFKLLNSPIPRNIRLKKLSKNQPPAAIEITKDNDSVDLLVLAPQDDKQKSQTPLTVNLLQHPNRVNIKAAGGTKAFKPGQRLNLLITSNRDAHMVCFFRDDNNQIQRIFPNRFYTASYVNAGETIDIPGHMPFEVVASEFGRAATLGCFTTEKAILSALPAEIKVLDFVNLNVSSFDEIRANIERLAGATLGEEYFEIKTQ